MSFEHTFLFSRMNAKSGNKPALLRGIGWGKQLFNGSVDELLRKIWLEQAQFGIGRTAKSGVIFSPVLSP